MFGTLGLIMIDQWAYLLGVPKICYNILHRTHNYYRKIIPVVIHMQTAMCAYLVCIVSAPVCVKFLPWKHSRVGKPLHFGCITVEFAMKALQLSCRGPTGHVYCLHKPFLPQYLSRFQVKLRICNKESHVATWFVFQNKSSIQNYAFVWQVHKETYCRISHVQDRCLNSTYLLICGPVSLQIWVENA